jgi:hypothetical protein
MPERPATVRRAAIPRTVWTLGLVSFFMDISSEMWAPLVLVVMNVVYSIGAYPAGALSDRVSACTLFLWGVAVLAAADVALAFGPGLIGAFAGIALWARIWFMLGQSRHSFGTPRSCALQ